MGELVESEPRSLASSGVSRRQLLARSAVAAGVVWAAPVVRTASAYAATSAGTSRPCTQFFVAGLSLSGNWYPAYPYGFVPSLTQTSSTEGTAPTTTTTVPPTAAVASPRRKDTTPRKMTRREYREYFESADDDTGSTSVTVPKLIAEWARENPSVPLLEPDVYPQITQTGAQGWAVLLPEVTGPNAVARQPRFIIGYSWQGSQYAYGYVDPQPANPALAGRRILFPSPVGREPGVGDEPITSTSKRRRRRGSTTTSSSSTTSSTTTTTPVAPTTATGAPVGPVYGPPPTAATTSTSTTTTSTTTTTTLPPTTTTTVPPSTTTSTTTTTTTLPPTTTTTRPGNGWGPGGSKQTTTTTAPPPTTTSTTSTTTTTIPGGGSTTTTTTTIPGGPTTTTTTNPFVAWWIAAHSGNGSGGWGGTVPSGPGNGGGNGNGSGAVNGEGKKIGFLDPGVGPAGPAGPGALSPTDSRSFADYFAEDGADIGPAEGAPIKGVILIYCQP